MESHTAQKILDQAVPDCGWCLVLRTFCIHKFISSHLFVPRLFMPSTLYLTNDGITGICYHNSNSSNFTGKGLLNEGHTVNHLMIVWLVWPAYLTMSAGRVRTFWLMSRSGF